MAIRMAILALAVVPIICAWPEPECARKTRRLEQHCEMMTRGDQAMGFSHENYHAPFPAL